MIWIFLSALSVAIAGTMGILMNKLVSKKQSDSLMNILGILMIFMGIQGALKIKSSLLMLISLALGTFIGSGIGIHDKAENLSNKLITKNISSETIKNAISIIIIQCSGSLSILAAMSLGLQGNPSLLQFKTILDSISGMIFASIYGISIYFAAAALFIYQGSIYLFANILSSFLTADVINEFAAVGSVLLIGMGLDLMKIKPFKALDYLPSMFIPIFWFIIKDLLKLFI